jgi:hypothetical protein
MYTDIPTNVYRGIENPKKSLQDKLWILAEENIDMFMNDPELIKMLKTSYIVRMYPNWTIKERYTMSLYMVLMMLLEN